MTGGILWMAGNFASTVFVLSVFKLSEKVESDLEMSTCLEMVKCQKKEWNLRNGVSKLMYLYIFMALVFVVGYRCDFRWKKSKKEGEKEGEVENLK